jgi:DNA-binding NarL/FixJ family response regulator
MDWPGVSIQGLPVRRRVVTMPPIVHITPWERSALELLAAGTTVTQIGGRLGASLDEIEERLAVLFAKFGAATRAEAVAAASRRGLLRG